MLAKRILPSSEGVSYKLSCFRSTHFIFLLTLTAVLLPGSLEVFYLV